MRPAAFALYTTFIWKVDGRNLMHFLAERMHPHAQWEIRQYANAIFYEIFEPLMPIAASLFKETFGNDLGMNMHPQGEQP